MQGGFRRLPGELRAKEKGRAMLAQPFFSDWARGWSVRPYRNL